MYNHLRYKFLSVCSILAITLLLSGCGILGSDDGPSLNGDLTYEVEGSEGDSVFLSKTSYQESSAQFETLGTVSIPSSGLASGDLADGDYDGYQLSASGISGDVPDITLRLMSDGEVLGEASTPDENGIFTVEVGDILDFSDLE